MDFPGRERRRPRVSIRLEAGYEDAERQVFLPTRDLSEGGVFLLAEDPPELGSPARVLLELPGEPALLRLPGVVARREPGAGFAFRFDFERLPEAARRALRSATAQS
jgi:hypothetical protein